MTPKEKAKELVDKFSIVGLQQRAEGYQCALIAVDEIILEFGTYYKVNIDDKYVSYWEEVKQEIEKL